MIIIDKIETFLRVIGGYPKEKYLVAAHYTFLADVKILFFINIWKLTFNRFFIPLKILKKSNNTSDEIIIMVSGGAFDEQIIFKSNSLKEAEEFFNLEIL